MLETLGGGRVNKQVKIEIKDGLRATDSQRCDQTFGQTIMLIDSIFLKSPWPERSTRAAE